MIKPSWALIAALTVLASATCADAFSLFGSSHPAASEGARQGWPQTRSDLKADPAVRFGVLPNGLRYAIMRNATPPGQASLRLRIAAGSVMESDDQQGLAHFLEHMAFNGSKAVPSRGEMMKILERHGLAFGADTNAQTGYLSTVYKLDLPKTDNDTTDTSLMLLREVAGNLNLSPEAIDAERGVILSEERLRDTPSYRITKARMAFLMAGQRPPTRHPIGLVSVIQKAGRAQIADFYQKYYRPERATLIAVGDFDPDAMEAKIRARFGDWRGSGPPGADPDMGPVRGRKAEYHLAVEEGAPTTIELAWVAPPDLSPDTLARRRREWIERLGMAVIDRRLSVLARADDPPFIAGAAFRNDQLRAEKVTGVLAAAQPDRWKPALGAVETEVRRVIRYGVRADELKREISEDEATLKAAAAGSATRVTPRLADELTNGLDDDLVDTSPADELALFEQVTKDLTPEQVSAALKEAFAGHGPLIFMSSPGPIDGGETALRIAFEEAEKGPLEAPAAPRQVDWPYTDFGQPSGVAEQKEVTDLDTVFVRFGNGVRLTVKPTKFRQDQVLVKVRVGDGLEGLAPDRQSVTWAGVAFVEGGLKQITADDAERALAGTVYGASLGAEDDAFTLSGETRSDDLPAQMQVLAAYVAEPGWRPEAFERMKSYGQTLETQYAGTDGGVLTRDLPGLMHGGDRRWTFPSKAELGQETLDELKAELAPALASGPIEVVVVGDVTVDKAIEAVSQTFGALPRRPDPTPPAAPARPPPLPAPVAQPLVETHTGRPDQAIALVAWPTDGFFANPEAARINTVLGDIMQLRLVDVLRLGEGVTYAPAVRADASQVWPHWGYLSAQMEAPPDKLAGFFTEVSKIAADLRDKEPSPDELTRAKQPRLDALEKAMATNEYWLTRLSGAQADPRRLDAIRSVEAGLERVTAADVRKAAQTYLRDEAAWKLEIKPQGG
jgi:zinc protease